MRKSLDSRTTTAPGRVYLVGAGPGDPGLLTRRGEALLARADVVVYDHLASARLLDLAPRDALRICAGKSVGHCTMTQDRIHEVLIEHARAGRSVVRLKGGDPLVFGRGAEEAEYLRAAGIPFEIVPGVTAGIGVTAYAGIPVTHRALASAVAYVTGHTNPESAEAGDRLDWAALARFPGTLVVYMGMTHLAAICRTLIREGKPGDTPAAIIESGTLAAQRTHVGTLSTLPRDRRPRRRPASWSPGRRGSRRLAISARLVRATAALRPANHRDAARRRGAAGPPRSWRPWARKSSWPRPWKSGRSPTRGHSTPRSGGLDAFDWLVFTSSNGVRFFIERLEALGRDLRALGHLRIAAIGPATAEALSEFHLRADLVPDAYRSESLAAALAEAAKGQQDPPRPCRPRTDRSQG